MSCSCNSYTSDNGANPYVTNVEKMTLQNHNFRTAIWTGCNMQMTLMCVPKDEKIGLEIHPNTDQFIRVEQGNAVVRIGKYKNRVDFQQKMCKGEAVFIPARMWHNVINIGMNPLKVSVIYAPPNHPKGTVHHTKNEAEMEEY